jgi:hypothetical protein
MDFFLTSGRNGQGYHTLLCIDGRNYRNTIAGLKNKFDKKDLSAINPV